MTAPRIRGTIIKIFHFPRPGNGQDAIVGKRPGKGSTGAAFLCQRGGAAKAQQQGQQGAAEKQLFDGRMREHIQSLYKSYRTHSAENKAFHMHYHDFSAAFQYFPSKKNFLKKSDGDSSGFASRQDDSHGTLFLRRIGPGKAGPKNAEQNQKRTSKRPGKFSQALSAPLRFQGMNAIMYVFFGLNGSGTHSPPPA